MERARTSLHPHHTPAWYFWTRNERKRKWNDLVWDGLLEYCMKWNEIALHYITSSLPGFGSDIKTWALGRMYCPIITKPSFGTSHLPHRLFFAVLLPFEKLQGSDNTGHSQLNSTTRISKRKEKKNFLRRALLVSLYPKWSECTIPYIKMYVYRFKIYGERRGKMLTTLYVLVRLHVFKTLPLYPVLLGRSGR